MKSQTADVAIVGAGIVGLAFAYAHARKGRSVVVIERTQRALGASIRNFGLIWPIGQPFGPLYNRALKSRNLWAEIAPKAGLWHAATGSLHLAYHPSELTVLEELVSAARNHDVGCSMLTISETLAKSYAVRRDGLLGALWSPTEINVDPRQALWTLPGWLEREHGVQFRFGEAVNAISMPAIETKSERWTVSEVFVCSGADFETLYPNIFAESGLTRCKLQMMRTATQPDNWALGPSLCAGLTLTHYDSFKVCRSLPDLKQRFEKEFPFYVKHGIHVLLSQTATGELTIGDSHEYGLALSPFDREEINVAILDYLRTFAIAPSFDIVERWHGIYPKLSGKTEFIANPEKGVTIVNGLGGAGMTFSFGLAAEIVK
jgi:D-hydroxyproline dehydrogenase subunit beta